MADALESNRSEVVAVRLMRLLSALSLVVSAPCVVRGQAVNPPEPPPPTAPTPKLPVPNYSRPAPNEVHVEERKMVKARGAMGAMMPAMMRARQPGGMMMMDAASMFLAHTGELQLTDAQVTRLAAIARRAESREKAMRARMDSAMSHAKAEAGHDGNGEGMMMMRMRMFMPTEAERKAQHEDDREAFSIPTPDQLATAWELMSMHHRDH
jgi:hypothetical protein